MYNGNDMEKFVEDALRTEPDYTRAIERLQEPGTVRLLHVAMGLASEAGEFVDMLKRHIYYGTPIDRTNLIEELGDLTFYERIGCAALETGYADMLVTNVNKLRARFPDKFTETNAVVRDLDNERAVLEGTVLQNHKAFDSITTGTSNTIQFGEAITDTSEL